MANAKAVLDFDGDGKTDYAVIRSTPVGSNHVITWYISLSAGGSMVQQFGLGSLVLLGDKILPEDYDGDGKCDIAVFRYVPGAGILYVLESRTNFLKPRSFPTFHSILVVQDYDGDGQADAGETWRDDSNNMIWNIVESSTGQLKRVHFGSFQDDDEVKGDFDGDGKADLAVHRSLAMGQQITFYVLRSSDGNVQAQTFGQFVDTPISADFDGDGKTDQAVARLEGQDIIFYVNRSSGGISAVHWGTVGDTPVARPYY